LIVNADDFGLSPSINRAVIQAHQHGILTTASLMVTGPACAEAVELARQHPQLGVGLHLTLICGEPVLPPRQVPRLTTRTGAFSDDPVRAGLTYFFKRSILPELEAEMRAQLKRFAQTGLVLDHVNGHLNLHLHPTVFGLLIRLALEYGIRRVRLTRDPLRLNLRLARGRWFYRLSHAVIFGLLSWRARARLDRAGIRHTDRVFGLLQTSAVDEDYVLGLLAALPPGDSELYSHPSLDKFKREADALVSPEARRLVRENEIQLIRYQDL
jgi:hopanoid biosynthesis associated protein HpnK